MGTRTSEPLKRKEAQGLLPQDSDVSATPTAMMQPGHWTALEPAGGVGSHGDGVWAAVETTRGQRGDRVWAAWSPHAGP